MGTISGKKANTPRDRIASNTAKSSARTLLKKMPEVLKVGKKPIAGAFSKTS